MRNYKRICVHYLFLLFISLNLTVFYGASINSDDHPEVDFAISSDIFATSDNAGQSRHYEKNTTFKHKDVVAIVCDFAQFIFVWVVICTIYTIRKVCPNKQHKSFLHTREPTLQYKSEYD